MAPEAEPTRAVCPEASRCLGCGYRLERLAAGPCPECGRGFDLQDPRTFYVGRELTGWDRKLLAPLSWPFVAVLATYAVVVLVLAASPSAYYGYPILIAVVLGLFLWLPLAVYLGVRVLAAPLMLPRPFSWNPGARRLGCVLAILLVTSALVLGQTPMHINFWLLRPGLEEWVADLEATWPPTSGATRRIRGQTVTLSRYSSSEVLFFESSSGGGFALMRDDARPLKHHYNDGSDGHLTGKWYWWTED